MAGPRMPTRQGKPMAAELFSVAEYYPDGSWSYALERAPADQAVLTAKGRTETVAAKVGLVTRVIITDSDDTTNFDWRFGQGVVFPTREDIADG